MKVSLLRHFDYGSQVILQELEETSQPYTDANDKCLFIRQWHPSTMTIGNFREITISGKSFSFVCLLRHRHPIPISFHSTENSELKNVLSSVSGIPEENIEYAMVG